MWNNILLTYNCLSFQTFMNLYTRKTLFYRVNMYLLFKKFFHCYSNIKCYFINFFLSKCSKFSGGRCTVHRIRFTARHSSCVGPARQVCHRCIHRACGVTHKETWRFKTPVPDGSACGATCCQRWQTTRSSAGYDRQVQAYHRLK